ncbi:MAG: DUF748 domain-containing protein [Desulfobacteraceae bacterium]|nr:MAG: DUF748 domain-containing protein [Desulfobacteraceae bacterium]
MINKMKRMFLYGGIAFILLLICSWWLTGRVAQYYLEEWLKKQGAEIVSVPYVSLNPFAFSVTIQDARIQKNSRTMIVLEKAVVDFSPWGLMQREIRISEAFFQGIRLVVQKDGNRIHAGGFCLSSDGTLTLPETVFGFPLQRFRLSRASVSNSSIQLQQLQFPDHGSNIRIEKMLIWDGVLSEKTQHASFALTGDWNGAAVKIESAFEMEPGRGSASCKIDLKKIALEDFQAIFPDAVSGIGGHLTLDSILNVEMENDRMEISQKGKGNLVDFHAVAAPYAVAGQSADFQTDLLVTRRNGSLSYARITASLNSHDFQVRDTDTDFTMIHWKHAGAEKAELSYKESFMLLLPLCRSSMLTIGVPPKGTPHEKFPLMTAETLSAKDVQIAKTGIRIGHLVMDNMNAAVVLDPDGMAVNIPEIQTAEKEREGPVLPEMEVSGEEKPEDRFGVQLDSLEVTGGSRFSFIDESVDPVFSESFIVGTAELKSLNTGNPGQKGHFYLSADGEDSGEMDISGDIGLIGDSLSLLVEGTISGYPLSDLSAYARSLLGHDITNGYLNAAAGLEIIGNQLCGEALLRFNGIQISPPLPVFSERLTERSVIPLDAAVGYLSDKNGNLEIEVPISGNPDDSGIGLVYFSQVILPGTIRSAAYDKVKKLLIPYKELVPHAGGMEIHDGADRIGLRLVPVILNAGEVLPGKEADEYTRQLSAFLRQEASLRIRICGVSTERDRKALKAGNKASHDMDKMLLDLARERTDIFREILVSHYGVPSSRIVNCRPIYDPGKNTKPRIEISL